MAAHRTRWSQFAEDRDDPMLELTCQEFTPILQTFKVLTRAGYRFDPTFATRMRVLELQMWLRPTDPDNGGGEHRRADWAAFEAEQAILDHTNALEVERRHRAGAVGSPSWRMGGRDHGQGRLDVAPHHLMGPVWCAARAPAGE